MTDCADEELVSATEAFCRDVLAPAAAEIDATGTSATRHLQALATFGMMGLNLSERDGGAGVNPATLFEAVALMAGSCASTASMVTAHYLATDSIAAGGNESQRLRWLVPAARGQHLGAFALTEPEAGSNPAAMTTVAAPEGSGYRIKGTKHFISNAGEADFLVVFAKTDRSAGVRGISAFVVETAGGGITCGPPERTMGLRGGHVFEVSLDCQVPEGNRLGPEGSGFRTALQALDRGRLDIAACCVGIAEKAFAAAVAWVKNRKVGSGTLAEFQGLQWMLADMAVQRDAARLLTRRGIDTLMRGERGTLEAAMAKLYATEALGKVVDAAVQIHGGMGYMREAGIETTYRDARIVRIYEGTSEIQRNIIAGQILKD
jgi:alkylation response protein AidB-like acyl-CoA dehydrogenase